MAAAAADVVIAGNALLADFASLHSRDVRMIPTCVEPTNYQPKTAYDITSVPTLVWLGSHRGLPQRHRTSAPSGAPAPGCGSSALRRTSMSPDPKA
jgi:hypothetical protein